MVETKLEQLQWEFIDAKIEGFKNDIKTQNDLMHSQIECWTKLVLAQNEGIIKTLTSMQESINTKISILKTQTEVMPQLYLFCVSHQYRK